MSPNQVDARAWAVISDSWVARTVDGAAAHVELAWRHSAARRLVGGLAGTPVQAPRDRVAFWSLVTLVSALLGGVLPALGTSPHPFQWVVPSVAGAVALVILVLVRLGARKG